LQLKKTRNSEGRERPLETTRLNSASTSTKSPRLSNTSCMLVMQPLASMSSNSRGPFQERAGSSNNGEAGACAAKRGLIEADLLTEDESGSDFSLTI